jgi:hypothetical protein
MDFTAEARSSQRWRTRSSPCCPLRSPRHCGYFFRKWRRAPESHRVRQGCSLQAPRLHRARHVLGGPAGSAPALRLSQSRMLLLQYGPRLKWVPWQDSRPHKPVYKTGAFLCRPQGSVEMVFPAGFAPAASTFAKWCAASYTSGTWCGMPVPMPVPPRRSLCGRQPCSLLPQYRREGSVGRVQGSVLPTGKWPLEPELRRPLRLFRPLLISLSHPAKVTKQGRS